MILNFEVVIKRLKAYILNIFKCHLPWRSLASFKIPNCWWVPNGLYSQIEPNTAGKTNIPKVVMSILKYILFLELYLLYKDSSESFCILHPISSIVSILHCNGSFVSSFYNIGAWIQRNQYLYHYFDFIIFSIYTLLSPKLVFK